MLTASGLSYIELLAPSPALLDATVVFYSDLGFQVIRKVSKEEIWLELFGPTTTNAHACVTGTASPPLTLHLRVVPSTNVAPASGPVSIHLTIPFPPQKSPSRPPSPIAESLTDPLGNAVHLSTAPNPFSGPNPACLLASSQRPALASSTAPTPKGTPSKSTPALPASGRRKRIGVLTSGGDSAGMNAAVRSVVRIAISEGCVPYAVFDGYQGLVDGGNKIRQFHWNDVRGYLHLGGTAIGTARCMDFKEKEGRLKAAFNLVSQGIDALVVIGGDGSLTGADVFRSEWPSLIAELISSGKVAKETAEPYKHLTIVGMVGSIDNDMSSTDITIGALTGMHRICEAVDSIVTTASSHSRAFVVEVMGRHCGWLALNAAISTGADYCFIPERPPPTDWSAALCGVVKRNRGAGKRRSIIIVCEGAIDANLKPITADDVKKVLETELHLDTRITLLGHVQRGGTPCANDRILATLQGVEAVRAVLDATPTTPSPLIGMSENKITTAPLMEAVRLTHSVAAAIDEKAFGKAMDLRDPEFSAIYSAFQRITIEGGEHVPQPGTGKGAMAIGIMHVGAPAGGMNAATRVATRLLLTAGHIPVAISNGFPGLANGETRVMSWMDVDGWMARGGSDLGTNRTQPKEVGLGRVAYHMQAQKLRAIMVIGGFEAYTALLSLESHRAQYPAFGIPIVHLPATVSNNVPGTEYSLGCDTALNAIVEACDCIKQSATASRRRVFVVEVQGGKCGYLALNSAIAVGATCVYTPEAGIHLKDLSNDIAHLTRLYSQPGNKGRQGTIVLRAEEASSTYTTPMIASILQEEARGLFDSRTAVLGHIQQGGSPSPLDRMRATRLAAKCVDWMLASLAEMDEAHTPYDAPHLDPRTVAVIGIRAGTVVFTPVSSLIKETDLANRRSKGAWWTELDHLVHIFGKYGLKTEATDLVHEKAHTMGKGAGEGGEVSLTYWNPHFMGE